MIFKLRQSKLLLKVKALPIWPFIIEIVIFWRYFYKLITCIILLTVQLKKLPFMQLQPNPYNTPQVQTQMQMAGQVNYGQFPQQSGFPQTTNMQDNNPNQDYFTACNQGLSHGFGAMFFNMRDPTFRQTNTPIKQQPSMHISLIIFNLLFLAGLIIGVIGYKRFFDIGGTIGIIVATYVLYVIICECCSDIRQYLQNMKKYSDFAITYDQMVKGRGYFTFWIECYHYVTTRTKNGTSRRKVVTHTATQLFQVAQTVDQSGDLQNIYDVKDFIFLHYLKRFYFSDDQSEQKFKSAYNAFVSRNTRDCHQSHTHTFQINGYQQFAAFTATGQGTKSLAIFHIFTFLGFASPYACIFQRSVARYDVGILKRLTV